jgi:2-polyprenyl-3-methyl-5-hydroxy-6-metoxy-1,4-benzoquinol methylase
MVFDEEPDHGLHDPQVRRAWTELLQAWLPPAPAPILDIGCGTGSLSVVLAGQGYQVTGIDLSPAMLAQAEAKATAQGCSIDFLVMDAAAPQLPVRHFAVIVCRHLLWALPEPALVLQRWIDLLKSNGRLVLIEGYWHTGAGLHAEDLVKILPASFANVSVQNLGDRPELWNGEVTDERYAIVAELSLTLPLAES